ncbi:TerC/Alx family metal homeostasis membrane protein, partial [Ancrocorticia populi]|uniref:TerC/Alx family metal homeostasis membrane protein n=1 Tax=Ancrocorticia populi TaxID=2175228 RepID=UPI003F923EA0
MNIPMNVSSAGQMVVHPWEWGALAIIIVALIMFDLFGHVRKAHEPTLKEAGLWSLFYIGLALLYGGVLYVRHGGTFAGEYYAGWLTEKALSLDNIFVFIIIIASFRVPRKYQQKVLLYGIVMALVMRLVFILVGAAIIERFVWVFFVFGFFLLYTAIKQVTEGVQEPGALEQEEFEPNGITRFAMNHFHVTDGYVGQKLLVRRENKTWITPLLLCIIAIGSIDLMFALDSIPAVYGLTKEPFIVFSANAFALLGLRQLFFLIDGLLDKLLYLHYGLAFILGFIAVKLMLHAFHGYDILTAIPEPNITVSLIVIIGTILVTVFASMAGTK